MELQSITEVSTALMPRVGPRDVLFDALRRSHFESFMTLEEGCRFFKCLVANMTRSFGGRGNFAMKRRKRTSSNSLLGRVLFYRTMSDVHVETQQRICRNELICYLLSSRYLGERHPIPKSMAWVLEVLPNYSDDRFIRHARMSRRAFGEVVRLLETRTEHYFCVPGKQKQLPVSIQLFLAIHCLSCYGNGASFLESNAKHGYSTGMIFNARKRVCKALSSLGKDFIEWPNANERRSLCARAKERYFFDSVFFLVDGTTHPFATVPRFDRNCWFDRKSRYSVQALVTCDIDLRVRHLVVGWPGSAHDARVLRSADYMRPDQEEEYFSGNEHGLGDAAFGIHRRVVPNYKQPLSNLPENRLYNQMHSSFRVLSEHCIGKVKNRFQGLKEVRIRLQRRKDLDSVVSFIMAGYVLHNILCDLDSEVDVPDPPSDQESDDEDEVADAEAPLLDPTLEMEGEDVANGSDFREIVKHQVLRSCGYE